MQTGMSTACFYSRVYNEQALEEIAKLGVRDAEVFFSARMEYKENFAQKCRKTCEENNMVVHAVHALPTQFEPQLLSHHGRQFEEAYGIFREVLRAGQILGAQNYVFHGATHLKIAKKLNVDMAFAGERVSMLAECAKEYGIALCYENVHWCWYNMPGFARELLSHVTSDNLYFTLDMKQAAQSGYSLFDYIEDMGDRLRHIHVCDYITSPERGILPCLPFHGETDWNRLRQVLGERGYRGMLMLEVYSSNYGAYEELKQNYEEVRQFFADV
ncbi:sugar phosphate isomerase/epimerase [Christensenellaceae bacterium OttesenSCG-928-K19]|nr:sugar phosphate isomerase/epimerase [Christensenellaceae bacterium OttesenSCG-928-K19]